MKHKFFLIFIFLVLSVPSVAAGKEIEAAAKADKQEAVFGDRIRLEVTVKNAKGYAISFPETPAELGDFSFIGSEPPKSKAFGKSTLGKVYVLGIYTTGTHVIPPVKIGYRKIGDTEERSIETRQIPIEVKSLLAGDDKDIRDIKGLASLGISPVVIVLLVFFLLAVLGSLIYFGIRKRAEMISEAARKKLAHEIAYEELAKLKAMDLPAKGMIKEYYIRLSDIARRYIENRFSYRAPEMTTEEFLNYIKISGELGPEHRDLLKNFLTQCDMVKFAKYGPTPLEILDSFKLAEKFVDQTKLVEKEPEKG